ncbi:MAG: hypothetical protein J4N34_00965, partial [Chloroflexi bacterium]|nr:hypothetical protein [Chloroflexota bacterium]
RRCDGSNYDRVEYGIINQKDNQEGQGGQTALQDVLGGTAKRPAVPEPSMSGINEAMPTGLSRAGP